MILSQQNSIKIESAPSLQVFLLYANHRSLSGKQDSLVFLEIPDEGVYVFAEIGLSDPVCCEDVFHKILFKISP